MLISKDNERIERSGTQYMYIDGRNNNIFKEQKTIQNTCCRDARFITTMKIHKSM